MADIELVIKIPEEIRLALVNNIQLSLDQQSIRDSYIQQAIINGIQLPKGHGALKDSDLLDTRLNFVLNHTGGYKNSPIGTGIVIAIGENLDADTIIKADTESEDSNADSN